MNEDLENAINMLEDVDVLVQKVFPASDALYNLHTMIQNVISTIEDMAQDSANEKDNANG